MSSELHAFLADVVNLPANRLKCYRETVDDLLRALKARVDLDSAFGIRGSIHSGSVAKKTAISTLNDMDVAVYLYPQPGMEESTERLLDYVRDRLREVYPEKHQDITVGRHAVRVKFHDAELTVDVVPIISEGDPGDWGKLLDQHTGEWIDTSIRAHRDFIHARKARHANFCELVRLTKWWRGQQELRFRSFLIELIWAHLLDSTVVTGDDLGEALIGFFGYVVRSELREPIWFGDEPRGAQQAAITAPVCVSDPVNPANNVAVHITEERRADLVRNCQLALESLAAAQAALTRNSARKYYQRVFGPRFVHEAGRETEASAAREIAAKIHADLRQLRVLSRHIGMETEAVHAEAISHWLESGLAETIELAFCQEDSGERRFSVRYALNGPLTPVNADPGGIPVHHFAGTTFRILVSGNERWRDKDEGDRQAFLAMLPGSWQVSQQPLTGGVAGAVDRSYISGALAAARSFMS